MIEVMGLAVLPARLKEELKLLEDALINRIPDISNDEKIAKHSDWYKYLLSKYYAITEDNAYIILQKEVGIKFLEVLNHAGVFKRNDKGMYAFDKFIATL